MSLRVINPALERHRATTATMLNCARNIARDYGNDVAGFAIVAWNERGETSGHVRPGGIVSSDALPQHIFAMSANAIRKMDER